MAKRMRTCFSVSLAAISPVALFMAFSFAFIGWSEEGSDDFAAGIILRDSAGEVMRVSLGEGDVPSGVKCEDRTWESHIALSGGFGTQLEYPQFLTPKSHGRPCFIG